VGDLLGVPSCGLKWSRAGENKGVARRLLCAGTEDKKGGRRGVGSSWVHHTEKKRRREGEGSVRVPLMLGGSVG
jgi:hypothetical protein